MANYSFSLILSSSDCSKERQTRQDFSFIFECSNLDCNRENFVKIKINWILSRWSEITNLNLEKLGKWVKKWLKYIVVSSMRFIIGWKPLKLGNIASIFAWDMKNGQEVSCWSYTCRHIIERNIKRSIFSSPIKRWASSSCATHYTRWVTMIYGILLRIERGSILIDVRVYIIFEILIEFV